MRLDAEAAQAIERHLFEGMPGVAELMLVLWNSPEGPRRARAQRALRALNPWSQLPSAVEDLAADVARLLLVVVYGADVRERVRVAGLLQSLCTESARIAERDRA